MGGRRSIADVAVSNEIKEKIITKYLTIFPLHTSNYREPIDEYLMSISLSGRTQSRELAITALNNHWAKMKAKNKKKRESQNE